MTMPHTTDLAALAGASVPATGSAMQMRSVLYAAAFALAISLLGTPVAIKVLTRLKVGQQVRTDGVQAHLAKRGRPTMGGLVIVLATLLAYGLTHLVTWRSPTTSGLLVLGLMVAMAVVGAVDDLLKVFRGRSLGLRARAKLVGQWIGAIGFALLAQHFPDASGYRPASLHVSIVRDTALSLGPVLFVIWVGLLIAGTSNGVNLADGADGLCAGACAIAFSAYVFIGVWQHGEACGNAWSAGAPPGCYPVRDPLDLAVVAAAIAGACLGFLWWNTLPTKIFMGDVGSLALGGALAGLAICTRTELLLVILGGLFVMETVSVVLQVTYFRRTGGKRLFKMAPIHHHFEVIGWSESAVVVRFWILCVMFAVAGIAVFYAGWTTAG